MIRFSILCKITTVAVISLLALSAQAAKFSFVAIGDTAYNGEQDFPPYLQLIDKINHTQPAFTLHIGDIWGVGNCSDAHMQQVAGFFSRYNHPLIYTPGDNEWTDCHEQYMEVADPLERLTQLRKMFFSKPESQGSNPVSLVRQSNISDFKKHSENSRWLNEDVLFFTLNIPGSNNNYRYDDIDSLTEAVERNRANVAWIRDSFRIARTSGLKAIVIGFHAELLMNSKMSLTDFGGPLQGPYGTIIKELRIASERFNLPVLLIHGDSHEFVIDRPFLKSQGENAPPKYSNVTRLEVFGAPEIKAVQVNVDTDTPWVFSFSPLY